MNPQTQREIVSPSHSFQAGQPAWDIALLFPAQGSWSEQDYLDLNTSRLVEFTDGSVEVLPMPTVFHQLIVKVLYQRLEEFVRVHGGGLVLFAPLPVRLRAGKFREPDIVYVRPERVRDVHGQPDGADLVMEVVSEGEESRKRDLERKPQEYAEAGIAEYWIVDPEERCIQVLTLDGKTYRIHRRFDESSIATSTVLAGLSITVKDVFAATT